MNRIFTKFNVYDQIGYILVGGIGLLIITFDFHLIGKSALIPEFNLQNLIIWLIFAYFLGHTTQALANVLIKEKKTEFSDSEKEILNKAKEHFNIEKQSWNEIYQFCYMLSTAKDITGHVERFNAYYSLYRGWFIVFLFESIFLLLIVVTYWFSVSYFILFAISNILLILFFKRLKRFYNYSRAKTLQTFLLLSKLDL